MHRIVGFFFCGKVWKQFYPTLNETTSLFLFLTNLTAELKHSMSECPFKALDHLLLVLNTANSNLWIWTLLLSHKWRWMQQQLKRWIDTSQIEILWWADMWRLDFGATIWQISGILHPTNRKIYIHHTLYQTRKINKKSIWKLQIDARNNNNSIKYEAGTWQDPPHIPHIWIAAQDVSTITRKPGKLRCKGRFRN